MTGLQNPKMNATLKKEIEKTLALALLNLETQEEALKFLREFLTSKEFEILSKRLGVIYWLSKKRSYVNIQNNLKVSAKTISDTRKIADKDIVKKIIKRIDADEWATKWSNNLKRLVKNWS